MLYTTDGLVIRSRDLGENDRLVTILTPNGQVTTVAKGARSMKSKLLNLTQPYVYGNFEINQKGNYSWIRGGSSYEMFYRLRDDVEKLFLAAYLCDVAYEVTGEGVPSVDILRLVLNTLYAVMTDMRPQEQLKAVFELKAAALSGYMPQLHRCEVCKKENAENMYFDIMNGALLCSECLSAHGESAKKDASSAYSDINESNILMPLTPATLSAIRFALSAPQEKIFSFSLAQKDDVELFSRIGEGYLLNHLERGFDSLDMYYSVK